MDWDSFWETTILVGDMLVICRWYVHDCSWYVAVDDMIYVKLCLSHMRWWYIGQTHLQWGEPSHIPKMRMGWHRRQRMEWDRTLLRWSWASLCGCRSSQHHGQEMRLTTSPPSKSVQGAGDLSALSGDAEDPQLQFPFGPNRWKCQTCWRPQSGSSTPGTPHVQSFSCRITCWHQDSLCGKFREPGGGIELLGRQGADPSLWITWFRHKGFQIDIKGLGVSRFRLFNIWLSVIQFFEDLHISSWQEPPPMCAPKALMHATSQVCKRRLNWTLFGVVSYWLWIPPTYWWWTENCLHR